MASQPKREFVAETAGRRYSDRAICQDFSLLASMRLLECVTDGITIAGVDSFDPISSDDDDR